MQHPHHDIKVSRGLNPSAGPSDNTAQVSQVADRANGEFVEFLIATGTIVDADVTVSALVEDSPDNSTYTPVADADLLGTEAGASFQFDDDGEVRNIGYNGQERYVRCTLTPANNTGAAPMCIIILQTGVRKAPIAQ